MEDEKARHLPADLERGARSNPTFGWESSARVWIMNENSNRLPAGLIWLLIYQWILVLVSLYFIVTFGVLFFAYREYGFVLYILVLVCWGTAISYASVRMTRRSPRGFLVGMICHLLLEILGMVMLVAFFAMGVGWDPFFLIFALMWLPFVMISGWGFFYLRALRKSLLSDYLAEV